MSHEDKQFVIKIVSQARGDDLHRAVMAFRNLTEKELDEEYAESGKTRRQIIQHYTDWENKIDAALEWLKTV